MPPLADVERDDGTVARRPTLAVYDPEGSPRHRILAVDIARHVVDWEPHGVPVSEADCEERLPARLDVPGSVGGHAQVRVRVISNGEELWNLIVVRPRDSAPQLYDKGSGVDLHHP